MSRYISVFPQETILKVLIAFLYDGKSHRVIQREILNLPAPAHGGGFVVMDILHHFDIKGNKKSILLSKDLDIEISRNSGSYQEALKLVKEYRETESKISEALRTRRFNKIDISKTELTAITKIRISQNVLRDYVLNNYENKCSLCDIDKKDLLVCSHIKSWAVDIDNRLNPANAICFCVLHDKLFDRGYFSLDDNYNIVFGDKADEKIKSYFNGLSFRKPTSDEPDIEFLKYHFNEICK